MRRLLAFIVLLVTALTTSHDGRAARDPTLSAVRSETRELIVLEVENCGICSLVRTEIAPAYARTARAQAVPMRFVDINRVDMQRLQLTAPVTVVPTILLMRDGMEIDRVTGYLGPENFLRVIGSMIGPVD